MKFNKSLIIVSVLIFCIGLSAVSAVDSSDISNSVDTDQEGITEIVTLASGTTHYSSEIAKSIANAKGTYNINYDYKIDTTLNIVNPNVIIEGNHHTIYGEGKQAFRINANDVTIQNLNFVNCKAFMGGAIYFDFVKGNVCGCSFTDCSAEKAGGAILSEGDKLLSVVDCTFTNCKGTNKLDYYPSGGAICCGSGSVTGCTFKDCTASGGGAIYMISGSVENCSFSGGSAGTNPTYGGGSAIFSWAEASVIGCTFNNCKSSGYGIVRARYGTVNYNIFEGNSGNAIYFESRDSRNNANFNFFGFQCNVSSFPGGLVSGCTVDSWIVLKLTCGGNSYKLLFTTNTGNTLNHSLPDYAVRLTDNNNINKEVIVKNNKWSDKIPEFDNAYVCAYSKVTGNLLDFIGSKPAVIPEDPSNTTGNDSDINKTEVNTSNNQSVPMENTGIPFIALLIALIGLPFIRRK